MEAANRLLDAALEIQTFCQDRRCGLRIVGPTALLIFAAFAGRPRDWLDIKGLVVKLGSLIDWAEVRSELSSLLDLKGDRSALDRLEALRAH